MANKGLILISHGERSKVNKLTAGIAFDQVDDIAKLLLSSEPSNLENLKQLCAILEVGSIKIAAQNCTEADIADLRGLVEIQRSKLSQDKAVIEADITFHVAIAHITGNPLIQTVTQAMLSWLSAYYKPVLHWSGRENTTLLEHAGIVDRMEADDVSGAASLLEDHLNRCPAVHCAAMSREGRLRLLSRRLSYLTALSRDFRPGMQGVMSLPTKASRNQPAS